MTHSIQALETFFSSYLPTLKSAIDAHWESNRKEAITLLNRGMYCGIADGWMRNYFLDMLQHAKKAPPTYTSPWDVL